MAAHASSNETPAQDERFEHRDHRFRDVDAHDDAPRSAAWAAAHPGPVATSKTLVPTPTEAAASRGSTTRPVIAPKNRS